jgi:putative polymerase
MRREATMLLARSPLANRLATAILLAALFFNAVLAALNAQIVPLSESLVIACELIVIAAAHAVALWHFKARMAPWYALIAFAAAFAIFRSAAHGTPEVKFFRDLLIIPTFVVLGMTYPRERLPRLLVAIQLIVLAGLLLEVAALDAYAGLLNIKSYYISTRGYTDANFWNSTSNLFVSASRPDDRFFAFVPWHRMSSWFLEPVSLGNYCIIVAAYGSASYRSLSLWQKIVLIGGTVVLIVGCDGRLAFVACLIIAAASLLARLVPRGFIGVIPLLVLILALSAVAFLGLKAGPDDFSGRLAHTAALLKAYGPGELLGVSDVYLSKAVDSGLAYLITTQSVLGLAVLWLCIVLFTEERDRQQFVFKLAVALYLSLSMLVSFSFLSIKTAALLWFILGALQRQRVSAPAGEVALRREPSLAAAPATGGLGRC